ncbi:MAG TPA: hypothetical protein VMS64_04520 [Candidatus Methylomirabilis sp.]|nr:hypothetical protein [Candidatus Methylomirabilis sp.]
MTEPKTDERNLMSRRAFTAAFGAATAALATLPGVPAVAGPPTVTPVSPARVVLPNALGAVNPALTYVMLDGFAFIPDFIPDGSGLTGAGRIYQDITGVQPSAVNNRLSAALPIPCGSTIYELNVAYQHQPIMEIWKRSMTTPTPFGPALQISVPLGSGASTTTIDVDPPIFVEQGSTVSVRFFGTAGDSVYGVTVGYTPPTQAFIPFTGSTPRVLDTRTGGGKLAPGAPLTIALGFPGARGAVLNVTITQTEGTSGWVAAFPANISWPGNSSVNWTAPNATVANGVITAMDSDGQITLQAFQAKTHVIVDRIGWLI